MSWLLVAFIPGLLMLAAFGLERLESRLDRDTVSADDVADFLAQARPDDVRTLARDGMPKALDGMHRRSHERGSALKVAGAVRLTEEWPNLPDPLYVYNRANPEFQPPRHADRV